MGDNPQAEPRELAASIHDSFPLWLEISLLAVLLLGLYQLWQIRRCLATLLANQPYLAQRADVTNHLLSEQNRLLAPDKDKRP